MASLKKPKLKKFPKKPKKNASNEAKESYLKRYAEVEKANKKAQSDYKAALKKRDQLDKKISGL